MNTTAIIWLFYDLGVGGDYEGLYYWLDNHDAKECGSSAAFMRYEYDGDLWISLKDDIRQNVNLTPRARIYVVATTKSSKDQYQTKGRYIIGRRRSAPWEGFGDKGEDEQDLDL